MNLPTIPILMVIILCLLLFKIYIAFRSPFWSKQPVQHWFGQWQYLFSYPHVIRQGVRPMDRHVSLNQITTQKMSELSDKQLHHQISILQEHYLNESGSVYRATKNILLPYFTPLQDGLVSFYFPPATSPATSAATPTPVGIITSRKLELIRSSSGPALAVYYVDYLCVHKDYRNQGIASQLIATHEYHQSRQLPYCPISLFKREEVLLPGVVPLCRYQTFTYVLNLTHTTAAKQDQIKAVRIGTSNAPLVWKPMLEDHLGGFSVQLLANWDCLMELLRTENIYVYLIRQRTAAAAAAYRDVGCLFFRKTGVHVVQMGQQLTCFGSIWPRKAKGEGVEIAGLEASLLDILNNTTESKGENYALLSIENISHNYRFLPLPPSSFWSTTPIASRPTAYYFYNYVHPTLSSKQVLFLG